MLNNYGLSWSNSFYYWVSLISLYLPYRPSFHAYEGLLGCIYEYNIHNSDFA